MAQADQAIRCWRFDEWPAGDRQAWTHGCAPGDPFDDPRAGSNLRQGTLAKTAKSYGRFLCFLQRQGWLDPELPPLQRVARGRLRAYCQHLKAAGNAGPTIICRFNELARALRIMSPGRDVSWIRKPDGVTIDALLPKDGRPKPAPDSDVAFAAAIRIMDDAKASYTGRRHLKDLVTYRDGLLIAVLAARGRRLRSMASLRVGRAITERDGRYHIELEADEVKTGVPDRFNLPERLTPYIRHYLAAVRPRLMAGRSHNAFWVGRNGLPLTAKAIQTQVFTRTERLFGHGFGPHGFRHAIATTSVLVDPAHPGLAAALLGISGRVVEDHYRLAGPSKAAMAFDEVCLRRQRMIGRPQRFESHYQPIGRKGEHTDRSF